MRKSIIGFGIATVAILPMVGCGNNADTVSKNISKECDKFHCLRKIDGINGITDKVEFEIVGLCSISGSGLDRLNALRVTCKEGKGKNGFKKHYVGMSDNMFFISTQLKSLNVSQYRTKIILRPTSVIPDLDLVTGNQAK